MLPRAPARTSSAAERAPRRRDGRRRGARRGVRGSRANLLVSRRRRKHLRRTNRRRPRRACAAEGDSASTTAGESTSPTRRGIERAIAPRVRRGVTRGRWFESATSSYAGYFAASRRMALMARHRFLLNSNREPPPCRRPHQANPDQSIEVRRRCTRIGLVTGHGAFIDYNGGLKIHSSLLNIVLHD